MGVLCMSESLDISKFEKPMMIRNMTDQDIDAILEIQRLSFPGMDTVGACAFI